MWQPRIMYLERWPLQRGEEMEWNEEVMRVKMEGKKVAVLVLSSRWL